MPKTLVDNSFAFGAMGGKSSRQEAKKTTSKPSSQSEWVSVTEALKLIGKKTLLERLPLDLLRLLLEYVSPFLWERKEWHLQTVAQHISMRRCHWTAGGVLLVESGRTLHALWPLGREHAILPSTPDRLDYHACGVGDSTVCVVARWEGDLLGVETYSLASQKVAQVSREPRRGLLGHRGFTNVFSLHRELPHCVLISANSATHIIYNTATNTSEYRRWPMLLEGSPTQPISLAQSAPVDVVGAGKDVSVIDLTNPDLAAQPFDLSGLSYFAGDRSAALVSGCRVLIGTVQLNLYDIATRQFLRTIRAQHDGLGSAALRNIWSITPSVVAAAITPANVLHQITMFKVETGEILRTITVPVDRQELCLRHGNYLAYARLPELCVVYSLSMQLD